MPSRMLQNRKTRASRKTRPNPARPPPYLRVGKGKGKGQGKEPGLARCTLAVWVHIPGRGRKALGGGGRSRDASAMGLFGRIVNRIAGTRSENAGARYEAEGRLQEAYEAYLQAGRGDDAVRVLIARAETEPDPGKRLTLLQLAASRTPETSEVGRQVRRKSALMRLDLVRGSKIRALPSELLDLARQLEAHNLTLEAAEAFGLAGDSENRTRLLTASGSIEALEQALESERQERSEKREREDVWKEIRDLDSIGKRLACLKRCADWLTLHPGDETVEVFEKTVRARIVRRGPVSLHILEQLVEVVLDHPLTIGRSDASVVIPSPALSRQHLQVVRRNEVMIEDLGSRNGTWLAGARVDAPLPVGAGIEVQLGKQVPVRLEARPEGGVQLILPGRVILAPLGPLRIDSFEISASPDDVLVLRSLEAPPILNGLTADPFVELSYGDQIRKDRQGPVLLEVVPS